MTKTGVGGVVAVRRNGELYWRISDHLGSTSVTAQSDGTLHSEVRYGPWGTDRYVSGETPTTMRYTGQRKEAGIGLYYYGARWYDPGLHRFVQADTIVPGAGSPQSWNKYSYVRNNPLRYIDPSGNEPCFPMIDGGGHMAYPVIFEYNHGPNYDEGRGRTVIEGIVMHKTGSEDDRLGGILNTFRNSAEQKSANYIIDYDGTIYQLIPDQDTAWHAGGEYVNDELLASEWTTTSGNTHRSEEVNQATIGIEVLGESAKDYTPDQLNAAKQLVTSLAREYDISPLDIVGHDQVAHPRQGKVDGSEHLTSIRGYVINTLGIDVVPDVR